MIRPARIVGIAAIALAAFGTAASIAAIGQQADFSPTRYSALEILPPVRTAAAEAAVDAPAGAACSVKLMVGEGANAAGAMAPVELSVDTGESMDLDMPGSAGFSVACGAGSGSAAAADAELSETTVLKGDLAAL
jgi:hypothetical protein